MTGEDAYLDGLAKYICLILPEDPYRQRRLLTAIKRRVRPRMPRWGLGLSMALLAALGAIVANDMVNAWNDARPHAQIAALPDGKIALKVLTESQNGTVTILWIRHISQREAKALLEDPRWQERVLRQYATSQISVPVSVGLGF